MAARTWLTLSWRDRALLAEAMALVASASLAVAILPFKRVAAIAAGAPGKDDAPPRSVRRIRWAVDAAARRSPWRALCIEQGLAAQAMLRRRGYKAALHYGVKRDAEGELAAHVWVRSGPLDVVGCENADDYRLLAVFGAES